MTPEEMRERAAKGCEDEANAQERASSLYSNYSRYQRDAIVKALRDYELIIRAITIPIDPPPPDPCASALKLAEEALTPFVALFDDVEAGLETVMPGSYFRNAREALAAIRKIMGE